jgi:(2Fe-2S) ferredoxin
MTPTLPFRYHAFACDQRKPEGAPCCSAKGSVAVIEALRREIAARNLFDTIQVTACGSLGLCESGPNLVVYPEGVWYSGVSVEDVPEIVTEHFLNGRPVERLMRRDSADLKKEIADNRGRMMAAMKARDAAGVLPDDLMDMFRGYQPSRIVLTAVELDLFTVLAKDGGATSTTVARSLHTDRRATETLLNALAGLGLLRKNGDVFVNLPLADRFLVAGRPDDATSALRHNLSLWQTWSTLTEVVRSGAPVRHRDMGHRDDTWTTPFIAAMHRNAAARAPQLVQTVGIEGVKRLIDIGGGSGAYAIAFARANPNLEAEVFDLETVIPIATRHIAETGLQSRIQTRVGNLRKDAFGSGYDLALLSAICHMLSPEENKDLFRRVYACLAPNARIVVQDHLMSPDKTSPRAGTLFAINMLVGTPGGSTYSEVEYHAWLSEAGFVEVRRLPMMGQPTGIMIGRRP